MMFYRNCQMSLKNILFKRHNLLYYFKTTSFSTSKWVEPKGFDTQISIYNSAIRKKVKFMTKRNRIVSWYCCGPTVYDTAHLGNFCSYMHFDIIRRIMENYFGLNVIMVMNITDIDDKIIARSKELNIDFKTLTDSCEREFFENMRSLNILLPTIKARVTDHIPEIIEFIHCLIKNGYGYSTPDGSVYFSVSKYPQYGIFQPLQELSTTQGLKENGQDFALWKMSKPEEPFWESPWGKGRPGWHIECSAIACKFLGESLDLHSGGVDLKFPHHENEEAQCCARLDRSQWVNYWLHSGHLYTTAHEKMSKSLRNTISIKEFLSAYSGNLLRILCLMIPYRNNIDFKQETIEKAAAIDRRFSQFIFELQSYLRGEGPTRGNINEVLIFEAIENTEKVIKESLSNDFDTNQVLSELLYLVSTTNSMLNAPANMANSGSPACLAAVNNLVHNTLQNFGYAFNSKESLSSGITEDIINSTVNFRNKIRETALGITKNDSQELLERKKVLLSACDSIRDDLLNNGIELKDRGKSTTWNYVLDNVEHSRNEERSK